MDDLFHRYVLPWPPSVNHYWKNIRRHGRPARALTAAASSFRNATIEHVLVMNGGHFPETMQGPLSVSITHHWPDRRVRDIDNYTKGILDALTHARVWFDDQQVRHMELLAGERVKDGCVVVEVRRATSTLRKFLPDAGNY